MLIIAPENSGLIQEKPHLIEIGKMVPPTSGFPVVLRTAIGRQRLIPYPDHNQLPRIC